MPNLQQLISNYLNKTLAVLNAFYFNGAGGLYRSGSRKIFVDFSG